MKKRYYIQAYTGYVYMGNGNFSDDFTDRYFWYVYPSWMFDIYNPHALDSGYCDIVIEEYEG